MNSGRRLGKGRDVHGITYVAGIKPFLSTLLRKYIVFGEVSSRRNEALSKTFLLNSCHTPYHMPFQKSPCDLARIRRSNPRNLDLS